MCKRNREIVDHLLLHYEAAGALWNDIFSRVGVDWVMLGRWSISLLTREFHIELCKLYQYGRWSPQMFTMVHTEGNE